MGKYGRFEKSSLFFACVSRSEARMDLTKVKSGRAKLDMSDVEIYDFPRSSGFWRARIEESAHVNGSVEEA